jgi:nitrate reductase NapE component
MPARAPTRLFKPVPKRPQPSEQCSEILEKQALPRTSVFVTVCSHPILGVRFVGIFVGIVLVSGEQMFTATFAIPNEGN